MVVLSVSFAPLVTGNQRFPLPLPLHAVLWALGLPGWVLLRTFLS